MSARLSVVRAALEAGDRPAIVAGDETIGYRALAERVGRVAAELRALGLSGADASPVALVPRVDVESVVRVLALIEAGVPFVPLHPRLTPPEREALVARTGAAMLPERVDGTPESAPCDAPIDDARTLAILFTSGTSGAPKGAVLSRRAFVTSADASAARLPLGPSDRWLLCMPPAHVGGLSVIVRALLARAAIVLGPPGDGFDAAAVAATLAEQRVTIASLVPTMLHRLLALAPRFERPPALRAILLGGAPADARLVDEARRRGLPLRCTYGLTEACSQVATADEADFAAGVPGARPLPGVEVRIEDGEILVRGPTLFDGYLGVPKERTFDPDGWFRTGDLGRLDEEGRLVVDGRRSDLVLSGGENVYPAEVEAALLASPGVREACVFGVPDAEWGERVAAALVLEEGRGVDDARAACADASTRLATFKRPRLVAVLPALPTRGIGKIDRRRVAELATPLLTPV